MAYSDYGGYAYRNGERVEERSDCAIKPDGDLLSTPGMWPGFARHAMGAGKEQWPNGHAVLGESPLYLVLYKQGIGGLYYNDKPLDMSRMLLDPQEGDFFEWQGQRHIDSGKFKDSGRTAVLECEGVRISIYWEVTDNHYVHAKMEFPSGVTWTGWSGYGVGAGLEDAGYGFDTESVAQEHRDWLEACAREEGR